MPEFSPRSRRGLLAASLAGAVVMASPVRSLVAFAQSSDAMTRLQDAAKATAALQSFHFTLSTPRGETKMFDSLELQGLEGDVKRPDRFRATVTAKAGMLALDLTVIGIGDTIWVSDPLAGEGAYREQQLGGAGGSLQNLWLGQLLNPDAFWLAALKFMTNPQIIGDNEIDGQPVTRIDGEITPKAIVEQMTHANVDILHDGPVPISIWLTPENQLRRLEAEGPVLEGEATDIIRRLDLTMLNEAVTIEPPTGTPTSTG